MEVALAEVTTAAAVATETRIERIGMFRELYKYIMTGGHPYKKSKRRAVYEKIAEECRESPDRVYDIAHNPHLASFYDSDIIRELRKRKIIVRE